MKLLRLFVVVHLLVVSHASTTMSTIEFVNKLQEMHSFTEDKELESKCQDFFSKEADQSNVWKHKRAFPLFGIPITAIGKVVGAGFVGVGIDRLVDAIEKKVENAKELSENELREKVREMELKLIACESSLSAGAPHKPSKKAGKEPNQDPKQRCLRFFNLAETINRELVQCQDFFSKEADQSNVWKHKRAFPLFGIPIATIGKVVGGGFVGVAIDRLVDAIENNGKNAKELSEKESREKEMREKLRKTELRLNACKERRSAGTPHKPSKKAGKEPNQDPKQRCLRFFNLAAMNSRELLQAEKEN